MESLLPKTPLSLTAKLAERARIEPHDPWLFYPHPRGWKWLSWREGWQRVAATANELGRPTVAAMGSVAKATAEAESLDQTVEALLLDLAEQAAAAAEGTSRNAESLARCAEATQSAVLDRLQPASRDITVLSTALGSTAFDDPASRHFFAWTVWSGAAVLLEPNPAAYLATAAWVRPSVLLATTPAALEELAARVVATGGTAGSRRAFGRLRALLLPAEFERRLSAESRAFWLAQGVHLIPLHEPAEEPSSQPEAGEGMHE